jgi:hypothetical protein
VLEIILGSQQIHYQIRGTGTWDDYSMKRVGDLELTPGTLRIEARPAAAPRNALLDLRSIELRPRKPAPRPATTSTSNSR